MEKKLQQIDDMGYNYTLTCIDGCHRLTISRLEWWSDDMSDTQDFKLPTWQGGTLQEVVESAYSYCNS